MSRWAGIEEFVAVALALVELLPEHRPPDEGVWAVYPHRAHLPAKVRAVVERLQGVLSASAALPATERAPSGPEFESLR